MAKPTASQRYALFQLAALRWFSVAAAPFGAVIIGFNLLDLAGSGNRETLALIAAGGLASGLFCFALYRVSAALERRYRAYIEAEID